MFVRMKITLAPLSKTHRYTHRESHRYDYLKNIKLVRFHLIKRVIT